MTINHFDLEFFEYNGKKNDKYKGMSQKFESEKFDLIIVDGPVGGGKNLPRSNILELIKKELDLFVPVAEKKPTFEYVGKYSIILYLK